MNIALFTYTGPATPLVCAGIASLRHYSDCEILFYGAVDYPERLDCPILPLPCPWDGRRMTQRMHIAANIGEPDDQILVLDNDLLFLADPFEAFENAFDMCFTSRHIPDRAKPINGGVSGFRKTPAAQQLWTFLLEQAECPSWPPYLRVRALLGREDRARELDWWTHQDLLCALYQAGAPIPGCTLYDLGPYYNWCAPVIDPFAEPDAQRRAFFASLADPRIRIRHFKEWKQHVCPDHLVFQRS